MAKCICYKTYRKVLDFCPLFYNSEACIKLCYFFAVLFVWEMLLYGEVITFRLGKLLANYSKGYRQIFICSLRNYYIIFD